MMFSEECFRQRLCRIIDALSWSDDSKEDLQQEVLMHLRDLEQNRPRQSASWYLQACKFRAQHLLSVGRSIDSPKRANRRVPLPEDPDLADEILNPLQDRNGLFFSAVSANDIQELLRSRLTRSERRILTLLVQGHSLREIGAKLGISHPTVLMCRRKIAHHARQLGLRPISDPAA